MEDEIKELPKEIKEAFICIDYELSVCNSELPKILDYITTLQEENEKSKSIIKQIKEEFNKKCNPCFTFYEFWLKVRDILGDDKQ